MDVKIEAYFEFIRQKLILNKISYDKLGVVLKKRFIEEEVNILDVK